MSLFFLIFTVITFFLSHACSRRTRPADRFDSARADVFEVESADISQQVEDWVKTNNVLTLNRPNENCFVVSERGSFLSFGHFFHLHKEQVEGKTVVRLFVQSKLMSSSRQKKAMSQKIMEQLKIKDAS